MESKEDTDKQEEAQKAACSKESLRLFELIIAHQNKTFDILERKAVLLISLCLAIIGYLFSLNIADNICLKILLVVIFVVLAIAAWFGSSVLNIRSFGGPGAQPEYLMHESIKNDFNEMADGILTFGDKVYKLNEERNADKIKALQKSLGLARYGILGACLWVIVNLLLN